MCEEAMKIVLIDCEVACGLVGVVGVVWGGRGVGGF